MISKALFYQLLPSNARKRAFLLYSRVPYRCLNTDYSTSEGGISMSDYTPEKVRNFSIVAHIDHGKSTLADRLLETTGTIAKTPKNKQVLDKLQVERNRGITVKAQTASLFYEYQCNKYLLNLVDTPGHVDFSYEVSRSLTACEGVILLVDATKGVQAQTIANYDKAFDGNLTIIPVINKIDVASSRAKDVSQQIESVFGIKKDEITHISAKEGWGIDSLLATIIKRIPCPVDKSELPLSCQVIDLWFDNYRGIILLVAVTQGKIKKGDSVMISTKKYEVLDVGILHPDETTTGVLCVGHIGYIVTGMKAFNEVKIGDILTQVGQTMPTTNNFCPTKSMVYAGFYPMNQSDFLNLRNAVEKLTLNDASVSVSYESSVALGQGLRLGFLGVLHMEVFGERLQHEYEMPVVVTSPSVPYKAILKGQKHEEIHIVNAAEFPDISKVEMFLEPMVRGTIILPEIYLGKVLSLCQKCRGKQEDMAYIDQSRLMLKYTFSLSEIILDFYDQLKSCTSGYASFDYNDAGYEPTRLVKLEIFINGDVVDELSTVVHVDKSVQLGKSMCARLQQLLSRQLFEVAIQAKVGGKIIARQSLKALRKDVTAKLYGGDMTRRRKLLDLQKHGKKKMRKLGKIDVPQEVFQSLFKK